MKKLNLLLVAMILFVGAVFSQPEAKPNMEIIDTSTEIDMSKNYHRVNFNQMSLSEMVVMWQGNNMLTDEDMLTHFSIELTDKKGKYYKLSTRDIRRIKKGKWDDKPFERFVMVEYMKLKWEM